MKLRLLSADDIDRSLSMNESIEAIAQAFSLFSSGQAVLPMRGCIEMPLGTSLFMPAYLKTGALALKVVSVFPENSKVGLPTVNALVIALDSRTGQPLALLDGRRLTALRTGAASGVATRLLSRKDARVLALFGAGGQAWDQARAVAAVRSLEEIRIYTPSGVSARRLAKRLKSEYSAIDARAAETPAQAVQGADIITCATTSRTPVFPPSAVDPGTHINGIGSFTPRMREVQVLGLSPLRIFVDSRAAALAEAGDLIQPIEEGYLIEDDLTEIGQVILGAAAGRSSGEEITFFKSVGIAVQDAAVCHAALRRAESLGLGSSIEL
jgi:ornithine cyclodeaminase